MINKKIPISAIILVAACLISSAYVPGGKILYFLAFWAIIATLSLSLVCGKIMSKTVLVGFITVCCLAGGVMIVVLVNHIINNGGDKSPFNKAESKVSKVIVTTKDKVEKTLQTTYGFAEEQAKSLAKKINSPESNAVLLRALNAAEEPKSATTLNKIHEELKEQYKKYTAPYPVNATAVLMLAPERMSSLMAPTPNPIAKTSKSVKDWWERWTDELPATTPTPWATATPTPTQ